MLPGRLGDVRGSRVRTKGRELMLRTAPRAALEDDLAAIEELATRPASSAHELAANLAQVYEAVLQRRPRPLRSARARPLPRPSSCAGSSPCALRLRDQRRRLACARVHVAARRSAPCATPSASSRYATDMLGELNIGYAPCLGPTRRRCAAFAGRTQHARRPRLRRRSRPAVPLRRPAADARHASQQRGDRPHRRRRFPVQPSRASSTPTRPASSGWSRA